MAQAFPAKHTWEIGCPVAVNTTGRDEIGVDLIPDLAREEKKMAGFDGSIGGGFRGFGTGGVLEGEGLSVADGLGRGCRGDNGPGFVEEELAS